jgi:hypothetical protein
MSAVDWSEKDPPWNNLGPQMAAEMVADMLPKQAQPEKPEILWKPLVCPYCGVVRTGVCAKTNLNQHIRSKHPRADPVP